MRQLYGKVKIVHLYTTVHTRVSRLLVILICVSATDLLLAWNPICLGLVEGVIGKIQLHAGKINSGIVFVQELKEEIKLAHFHRRSILS